MCMGLRHESICTHWGQKNSPLKKFHIWATIWFPSWFPLDICEKIIFPWKFIIANYYYTFFSWKMKIIWCPIFCHFYAPMCINNLTPLSWVSPMRWCYSTYLFTSCKLFCKVTIFWKNNFFIERYIGLCLFANNICNVF